MRYSIRGVRIPYKTAKVKDGTKSSGRAVPPTGAGKSTIVTKMERWVEEREREVERQARGGRELVHKYYIYIEKIQSTASVTLNSYRSLNASPCLGALYGIAFEFVLDHNDSELPSAACTDVQSC